MGPIEAVREVVCDAGPLIHLDELGALDLLADFQGVWVPEAVRAEVQKHRPAALRHESIPWRLADSMAAPSRQLATVGRTLGLHPGERRALLLLENRSEAIFLTDDAAARSAARILGRRAHGTLAILLRAIRRRQRTRKEILEVLESIPRRSSLHIKTSLLERVIREVEGVAG